MKLSLAFALTTALSGHFYAAAYLGNGRNLEEEKRCATKIESKANQIKNKEVVRQYREGSNKIGKTDITVHWHKIQTSAGTGGITDAEIVTAMEILNQAFNGNNILFPNDCSSNAVGQQVDTGIQFTMGTTTTTTDDAYYTPSSDDEGFKSNRVGTCAELNLWVPYEIDGGVLGYATFPTDCNDSKGIDGVVTGHKTFSGVGEAPYNEGDTLVHEVGHWLGLYHTFQGGCECRLGFLSNSGDSVDDTPDEKEAHYGKGLEAVDTCSNSGDDPINNYMDYSDDCCLYQFTNGQVERMQSMIKEYRTD